MKSPAIRHLLSALCLGLLLTAAGRADDAPDAAFNQWQAAFDAAAKRVGERGSLREALDEAGKNASRMRDLAKACQARVGDLEAAAFQVKFWKGEWEQAQRETKRKETARDQKYAELLAEIKAWSEGQKGELTDRDKAIRVRQERLHAESKPLDAWLAKDNAWKIRVAAMFAQADAMPKDPQNYPAYISAWNAADAESKRCAESIRNYNQAIIPWNKENQQIKDDIVALDAAWAKLNGDWAARMEKIRVFFAEEGKRVLEAKQVADKKEREYHERQAKQAELTATQKTEIAELSGLLQAANATLQVVLDILNTPAPTPAAVTAAMAAPAGPYATHTSDAAATAAALPADETKAGPAVRSRILMLAPLHLGNANDQLRQRLQTEAAAKVLADQYAPVTAVAARPAQAAQPAGPATPPLPAADAAPPLATPAPAVNLGPAALGPASDSGDGAVLLGDDALHRAFDPRVFISDAQYQQAQDALEHYGPLIPKLRAQLEKMQQERDKTAGYSAEFAALRREIQRNAIGDVLSVYASSLKLKEMGLEKALEKEGNAAARAVLEAQGNRIKRIRQAVETAKTDTARRQANRTPSDMEQHKIRMEALEDGTAAISEILADQIKDRALKHEAKFALEQLSNTLKFYGKVSRDETDPTKTKGEQFQEKWQTPIKAIGIFCVPVALGVGLESAGERGMEWAITQDAVASLNTAVKSQDDAIIFLADRLTRAELIAKDAQKTVQDHQAVPAARRQAFQLGN